MECAVTMTIDNLVEGKCPCCGGPVRLRSRNGKYRHEQGALMARY